MGYLERFGIIIAGLVFIHYFLEMLGLFQITQIILILLKLFFKK